MMRSANGRSRLPASMARAASRSIARPSSMALMASNASLSPRSRRTFLKIVSMQAVTSRYDSPRMLTLALTVLVGVLAGGLGALLGIGGGVVLVPLVHAVLGRSFREAAAVSLVAVLATSASVAASTETRRLLNVRLAIVLLIFSVSGATFGASVLHLLLEKTYERIFGLTAAVIAVGMLQRLNKRNVRT